MKTNDLKRQLAAVMAVALTFSSVPAVSVGAVSGLNHNGETVVEGESLTFNYSKDNEGNNVKLTSSNGSADSITDNQVTFNVPGTTTITATEDSASNTAPTTATDTSVITVLDEITGELVGEELTATIPYGSDELAKAQELADALTPRFDGGYSNAEPSEGEYEVKVTGNDGKYTATLKLTSDGEKKYKMTEVKKNITITVAAQPDATAFAFDEDAATIATESGTLDLSEKLVVTPENGKLPALTWTSSDPTVATVSTGGLVTVVKPGTTTITVSGTIGETPVSDTFTVTILDTIDVATSSASTEAVIVEVDDVSDMDKVTLALDGKLKVDTSNNTLDFTNADYKLKLAANDEGKDPGYTQKYDVTIELTAEGAKKFKINGNEKVTITAQFKKAEIAPTVNYTGEAVSVSVSPVAEDGDKKEAALTAVRSLVSGALFNVTAGGTKLATADYTLTAANNEGTDSVRVSFALTEAGKKKYTLTNNTAGAYYVDVPVTYTEAVEKVAFTYANGAVAVDGIYTDDITSEINTKALAAVEAAVDAGIVDGGLELDTDYTIAYAKNSGNSVKVTVTLTDTTNYAIDAENAAYTTENNKYTVSGNTVSFDVPFTYTAAKRALDYTVELKDSEGTAVTELNLNYESAGMTNEEKTAMAKTEIAKYITSTITYGDGSDIPAAKAPVKDTHYEYKIDGAVVSDSGTVFTVSIVLKEDGSALYTLDTETTDTVTVKFSNQSTPVSKVVTPSIVGGDDGIVVKTAADTSISVIQSKVKKAVEEAVSIEGADALAEGDYVVQYVYNETYTSCEVQFILVNTDYILDPSLNPETNESGKKFISKTITIELSTELVEITPVLGINEAAANAGVTAANGTAKMTYDVIGTEEVADVEGAIKTAIEGYVEATGIEKLQTGDYEYVVEKTGGSVSAGYVYTAKFNLKNTETFKLSDEASDTLVFNVTLNIQDVVIFDLVDEYEIEVKRSASYEDREASCQSYLEELVNEMLASQMAEGDYSAVVTSNGNGGSGAYGFDVEVKVLKPWGYKIKSGANGVLSKDIPAEDVTYDSYSGSVWVQTKSADRIKITPIITTSVEEPIVVDVYADDDDATKNEKVLAKLAEVVSYNIYDKNYNDITDTLARQDVDAEEITGIYTFDIFKSTTIVPKYTAKIALTEGLGDADYEIANIADNPNTDAEGDAITAVTEKTFQIVYNVVEEETNTDKWVKAEDGTYSYTASKTAAPGDAGKLVLDLGEVDLATVSNITATLNLSDGGVANGCLGATSSAEEWTTAKWSSEDAKDGVVTVSLDVDGVTEAGAELQLWWANADTTVTLKEVKVSTEEAATKPEITKIFGDVNRVGINWSEVKGATGYGVFVKANGKWSRYCMTGAAARGKYVTGLKPGTSYAFAVKAYVDGKWTDIASEDIKTATPLGAVPVITKAKALTGKVEINWAETKNATGYAVWVKDGKTWTRFCMTGKAARGKYVTGLKAGSKYAIAVKAYVDGKWTDVTSDTYVTVTAK